MALISLKALLSDPKDYLANWNESDADPCKWTGIRCQLETGRVHMLYAARLYLFWFAHLVFKTMSEQ